MMADKNLRFALFRRVYAPTINTICTFLQPDSGTIIINGHCLGKEDDKIRQDIGIVFQENLLDDLLSVPIINHHHIVRIFSLFHIMGC